MKTMNATLCAVSALPFLAALVGGCMADAGVDAEDESDGQEAIGSSNVHLMPTRPGLAPGSLVTTSAPASAKLAYYGGPVIANVKVVTIFWGSTVNYASQLNAFYSAVTSSAHFDWLSEYNTPTQKIGRGTLGATYDDTTAPTGSISDAAIQSEIKKLISAGEVPAPDADTYYAVHFAPGVSVTSSDGSRSCVQFCAYHGTYATGSPSNPYVYYGVIPDQGGSCAGGCGADSSTYNNTTSVASHELIEAVTDAAVGVATSNASPLAWYDTTYGEIGDICNARQGTVVGGDGKSYVVQAEFSNKLKNCIVASGTGSGGGGTCSHAICTPGDKLTSTCDPCAAKVCAKDSYCCGAAWDSSCVGEVKSICGQTCP
jgi:hypothetical protein